MKFPLFTLLSATSCPCELPTSLKLSAAPLALVTALALAGLAAGNAMNSASVRPSSWTLRFSSTRLSLYHTHTATPVVSAVATPRHMCCAIRVFKQANYGFGIVQYAETGFTQSNQFIGADSWSLSLSRCFAPSILPPAVTLLIYSQCRRLRIAKGLCPTCSYDLTGNTSGTCPECGSPIPALQSKIEIQQSKIP